MGYSRVSNEVGVIVDRAQAAIYDVTERGQSEDYSVLESLLQPRMDEIAAVGAHVGHADFSLNGLMNGLTPARRTRFGRRRNQNCGDHLIDLGTKNPPTGKVQ